MAARFLLYGANGYVGEAAARLAVAQGMQPILAGRARAAVEALAGELGVEARVCALDDAAGRSAMSRLHGPEAGLVWTTRSALAAVRRVLGGDAPPGYRTPGMAFGPDFVLESEGVGREDVA